MVLRFLMRYLANNEQFVNKLADSRPVRRAARFVVYLMHRSTANELLSNPSERGKQLLSLLSRFATNVKEGITEAKGELKKKQPK